MTTTRLVILGASGDLTGRYLLRALAELVDHGRLPEGIEIVGVAREPWDTEHFRSHAQQRLAEHASDLSQSSRDSLIGRLEYIRGDVTEPDSLRAAAGEGEVPLVAYLALPPTLFPAAISGLASAGPPDGSRVVVEKPFGTDLASAQQLNYLLHRHFPESALFRIDHFLGKQTVQNVLGLRFANRMFEPLWCGEHIESVDIVWDETVALEGRAGYYDGTGALRDMIQNHLLQLLCLVAMERPDGLGEGPLRDAKMAALKSVRRLGDKEVDEFTVRGRYTYGSIDGRHIPDYLGEPGVDPEGATETFAEVTLFVDNERWRGVPFRLRTGKALGRDTRQVRITLRHTDRLPFDQPKEPGPNVISLSMDPDKVSADLALNGAGDPFCLEPAHWELELAPQEMSAYARLLVDVLEGDPSLSIRGDEAEECWRIVEPILTAWNAGTSPIQAYAAGSLGPTVPDKGETRR